LKEGVPQDASRVARFGPGRTVEVSLVTFPHHPRVVERMRASLPVIGVVLALGCSSGRTEPGTVLAPGVWGGERANLIVGPDSVRAEFDCASGRLDAPVVLDALGRFDVGGTYRFEAGPVFAPVPAHWTGQVVETAGGSELTLEVTVHDPKADPLQLGPYHLKSGVRLTLGLCA
jgi:hypothetical protein